MSLIRKEAETLRSENRARTEQGIDDRSAFLGLLAILSLAVPALVIRNLFPELNPLYLVGLGAITYSTYAFMLVLAYKARAREVEKAQEIASTQVGER